MASMAAALAGILASGQIVGGHAGLAQSQCKDVLNGMTGHTDFELAALCRTRLPTDMCKQASNMLGAQPWGQEKIDGACQRWESSWAPKAMKAEARTLETGTGNKPSTSSMDVGVMPKPGKHYGPQDRVDFNPWLTPEKGFDPWTMPFMMATAEQPLGIPAPSKAWEASFRPYTTTPPPGGTKVDGTVLIGATNPQALGSAKGKAAITKAIADLGGVEADAVSLKTSVEAAKRLLGAEGRELAGKKPPKDDPLWWMHPTTTKPAPKYVGNVTAEFGIKTDSKIEAIAIASNIALSNAKSFNDLINMHTSEDGVKGLAMVLSMDVKDSFTVPNRRRRSRTAPGPTLPGKPLNISLPKPPKTKDAVSTLPKTPRAVLGSFMATVDNTHMMTTNPPVKGAVIKSIAAVTDVPEEYIQITTVEITPVPKEDEDASKPADKSPKKPDPIGAMFSKPNFAKPKHDFVTVYFVIQAKSAAKATKLVNTVQNTPIDTINRIFWQNMLVSLSLLTMTVSSFTTVDAQVMGESMAMANKNYEKKFSGSEKMEEVDSKFHFVSILQIGLVAALAVAGVVLTAGKLQRRGWAPGSSSAGVRMISRGGDFEYEASLGSEETPE